MITAKDYQTAIDVQDACNLSGVTQSLAEVVKRIESGTSDRNTHPIVKLYVYKLWLLAFPDEPLPDGFYKPYMVCADAAKDEIVVP